MSDFDAFDYRDKRVLVCGASDGIGHGIAKAFLDAGADVSITGTRERDAYDSNFDGMHFYSLNVQSPSSITALAETFDSLDVLVNSVGSVLWKKAEFERDGFAKILDINLAGAMQLCTEFLPLLRESGGSIVNIDSVVSIRPAVNNPAYSASKAGMVQLTKTLAMKWGHYGVRVNSVAPGMVPTKLTANQSSPEQEEAFGKSNPIARFGTPADIAGSVLFLASPLASYVTGHQLVVDGGLTL
ncbi:MAG: SDR family oxidoreductase [Pseudomonadota bacterium]